MRYRSRPNLRFIAPGPGHLGMSRTRYFRARRSRDVPGLPSLWKADFVIAAIRGETWEGQAVAREKTRAKEGRTEDGCCAQVGPPTMLLKAPGCACTASLDRRKMPPQRQRELDRWHTLVTSRLLASDAALRIVLLI